MNDAQLEQLLEKLKKEPALQVEMDAEARAADLRAAEHPSNCGCADCHSRFFLRLGVVPKYGAHPRVIRAAKKTRAR